MGSDSGWHVMARSLDSAVRGNVTALCRHRREPPRCRWKGHRGAGTDPQKSAIVGLGAFGLEDIDNAVRLGRGSGTVVMGGGG